MIYDPDPADPDTPDTPDASTPDEASVIPRAHLSLVPVPPEPYRPPTFWATVRQLYVQGVAQGPGYPNRSDLLASLGMPGILSQRPAPGNVVKVGRNRVVFPHIGGLSVHFRVDQAEIAEMARVEDWAGLRSVYRSQLRQYSNTVRNHERLQAVERFDRRAFKAARLGLRMVTERLEMLSDVVDVDEEGVVSPFSGGAAGRELESLARSAVTWHALGRRALGFPVEAGKAVDVSAGLYSGDVVEAGALSAGEREDAAGDLSIQMSGEGMVENAKPNVGAELGKDDAERLHGFLSMLGRAQDASQGGEEAGDHAQAG